jgi:predicted nucleic acid-binding protein
MILVDTSVWIEHLRAGSDRLKTLLLNEQVLCHSFVVGELACGTLQKRSEIVSMLKALPEAHLLEHEEVLSFLEARRLYGRGIGWVDAHLLASTLLTGCTLWTFEAAPESSGCLERLDVKFSPEITRRQSRRGDLVMDDSISDSGSAA